MGLMVGDVTPLLKIIWLFWLDYCSCENICGFCINYISPSIIVWIGVWFRARFCFFDLSYQWLFWATFIDVVPRYFVEVAPLPSVLLHLLVVILFLWLRLVVLMLAILWIRVSFTILWLLQIYRHKFPLVLVLKFMLYFENISIRCSQWLDI